MTKLERIATEKKVLKKIAEMRNWLIDNGIEMEDNTCSVTFNDKGYLSFNLYKSEADQNGKHPNVFDASILSGEKFGNVFYSYGKGLLYHEYLKDGEF